MHKKPRGTPYHFSVNTGGGLPPQEMTKHELHLPHDKASIERQIAEGFAIDSRNYELYAHIITDPVQNGEHDIDFTVETDRGAMGLELVEYAPVGKLGFSGPKPNKYDPVERAREVIELIKSKNNKYRQYNKFQELMLLVYVTDNAWALDIFSLQAIRFLARTENTVFRCIAYYKPIQGASGIVHRVFPISDVEYEELRSVHIPREGQRVL